MPYIQATEDTYIEDIYIESTHTSSSVSMALRNRVLAYIVVCDAYTHTHSMYIQATEDTYSSMRRIHIEKVIYTGKVCIYVDVYTYLPIYIPSQYI